MAAETPTRLRFPREAHIKLGRDFRRTRQEGERLANGCLILNWRRLPAGAISRIGLVVSGKVGNAVLRSRVRRLLREAFRLHQYDLSQAADLVLVARPSIVGKAFADVDRDFLTALRRARLFKTVGGLKP